MARDDYGSGRSGGYTSGGSGAYGAVPVAPPLPHTAPQSTKEAIATGTQVYSQLPGFKSTLAGVAGNISSDVAGQVPYDVIALLQQQGAEGNAVTGAASNAAYLRGLGLTSLGLKEQGQKDLESILPHLPGANVANNPAFYISPEQQYERDLQSNIFAAAPNPTLAAGAAMGAAQSGFNHGAGSIRTGGITPGAGSTFGSPASTAGGMNYPNYPALGAIGGGWSGNMAGANPYTDWSSWWAGGSPAMPMNSNYAARPVGPNQGFEATEYGTGGGTVQDMGSPWYGKNPADYGTTMEAVQAGNPDYWSNYTSDQEYD